MSTEILGQLIGGYRITQLIGQGGMGAVYLAEHPSIGRKVAIKVLLAESAAKPKIVERFFAEAKAVNLIRHPNIVDVTDINQLPDGRCYLVMEYLEGTSLSRYLVDRKCLSLQEAAALILQMSDALGAAHARGIVHRDLKPDNIILLPREGDAPFVKILDFGIAKLSAIGTDGSSGMTQTGAVMGTPTYMSPEQAMGKNKEVDGRTDIYALGVILFQMLAGRVPFDAEAFGELMLKHLYEPVPPVSPERPDLPAEIDGFIYKAMGKRREDRFGTMQQFAQELVRLCTMSGTPATLPTIATPHSLAPPGTMPPNTPARPGQPVSVSNPTPHPGQIGPAGQITTALPPPGTPTTLGAGAGEVGNSGRRRATIVAMVGVAAVVVGVTVGVAITHHNAGATGSPAAVVTPATGGPGGQTVAGNPSPSPTPGPTPTPSPTPVPTPGGTPTTPVPTVASTVHLTVTSTPPGARVTVAGTATPIAPITTPGVLEVPLGKPLSLSFALSGYEDATQTVNPTSDGPVQQALKALTVAVATPPVVHTTQTHNPVTQNSQNTQKTPDPTPTPKPGLTEKPAPLDF